jgi:uncharacterized YigZ family protein
LEESFKTLAAEYRREAEKVKGSRFLATVAPVHTTEGARALLERVRREYRDARHHGSAWRLRSGEFRHSDDGEPSGSTGRPILAAIDGRELADVVVVVTRWFGGTKLGVGGLVRAYGTAAGQALDLAPVLHVTLERRFRCSFPYECTGPVEGLLAEYGVEPGQSEYGVEVSHQLSIPLRLCAEFLREFTERTSGRGRAEEL